MSARDELTADPVVTAPALRAPVASAVRAAALRARAYEMARFLSVGGVAFVVDLGVFNLLRFGPGELLEHKPLTAKILSVVAATVVSWLGNRHWTFSRQRTDRPTRELVVFTAINLVCAVVPVLTLAFSHYALALTTPLADNVATVIGIAVGTAMRYLGYKRWVFTGEHAPA